MEGKEKLRERESEREREREIERIKILNKDPIVRRVKHDGWKILY